MNVFLAFCAYMTFIYLPWDIFVKPLAAAPWKSTPNQTSSSIAAIFANVALSPDTIAGMIWSSMALTRSPM